jgi:hypothetical protein
MPSQLSPSEQLTYSTVRIECTLSEGGTSTGSGYFFRFVDTGDQHVPAIVTNKHVVEGATVGRFALTKAAPAGGPQPGSHPIIELDQFAQRWIHHPDPKVDLCAMPIGPLLNEASEQGVNFFYIALDKSLIPSEEELAEMTALEDVIMIGYPNGIWDAVNNMPLIRRGITATHPNLDYNGQSEFMIDAACFPGSSGSPVFLFNVGGYATRSGGMVIGPGRIKLLGTLYAGPQHTAAGEIEIVDIPVHQRPVAFSRIPNNLGLVIKARRLLELEQVFERLARDQEPRQIPRPDNGLQGTDPRACF